jgi:hypothetical protein
MFVRRRMVRGIAYYQIVEGIRTGTRVHQRLVLALGREPDPRVALQEWQRLLAELEERRETEKDEADEERDRMGWWQQPLEYRTVCPAARKLVRTEARIAKLEPRVAMLAMLIKDRKVGVTPKRKGD